MNAKILMLFLATLFSYFVGSAKEDSLRKVLSSKNLSTDERIATEIELASTIMEGNKDEARQIIDKVFTKITSKKHPKLFAEALNTQARIEYYFGDAEKLETLLPEFLEFTKTNKLIEQQKKAYKTYYFCFKYYKTNDVFKLLDEAITLGKKEKDNDFLRWVYSSKGILAYQMGVDSKPFFIKALEYAKAEGNQKEISGLSMNIGISFYTNNEYEKSLEYYAEALASAEKLKDTSIMGMVNVNIGITYAAMFKYEDALEKYDLAVKYYTIAKDTLSLANAYVQYGRLYDNIGDYEKVVKSYLKSAQLYESRPNQLFDLRNIYSRLSGAYGKMKLYDKQLEYNNKQLAVANKMNDPYTFHKVYRDFVSYYFDLNQLDSVKVYLDKTKDILVSLNAEYDLFSIHISYGNYYLRIKDFKNARVAYIEALEYISNQPNEQSSIAGILNNLGVVEYEMGNFKASIDYYKRALDIRLKTGVKNDIMETYQTISNSYKGLKDWKNAYDYLVLYTDIKDTLFRDNLNTEIARMEALYEKDKQEKENMLLQKSNALKDSELEQSKLENQRKQIVVSALSGGGLLVVILALVLYRAFLRKRKDNQLLKERNEEISQQKELIEEKNRDIMDSIRYAQRIQEAILPPEKIVKSYLSESFIIYKPKDLVSGDFYWMKTVQKENENLVFFAAVDCTGHGVPGAFVSIVGHNGLNRAVNEFGLRTPAEILGKLNEFVQDSFTGADKSANLRDGMDIALCCLDLNKNTLSYAGANNPLWLITKGQNEEDVTQRVSSENPASVSASASDNLVFLELKANKQPIGFQENFQPFKNHTIQLSEGDTIYIFSDGYVDQFGGPEAESGGKKFKAKRMRELLMNNYALDMSQQRNLLEGEFNKWKGNLEQIDDVCMIGLRF
jgi:serine phosphatase RsbU (regulator of sigma subunit)